MNDPIMTVMMLDLEPRECCYTWKHVVTYDSLVIERHHPL